MLSVESPQTNTLESMVDCRSAIKPVSIEIAKLIIIKKDGEGASMDISHDITIGREKDCDIRIKLTSISRLHARIFIDENGEYHLSHLSKTNPSLVNGVAVKETRHLKDGDELTFGDRQFKFVRPESKPKKLLTSASKMLSVEKHVPSLETIDEGHTFDFSRMHNQQQSYSSSSNEISPVKLKMTLAEVMTEDHSLKVTSEDHSNVCKEDHSRVKAKEDHSKRIEPVIDSASVDVNDTAAAQKRKTALNTPTRQAIKALKKTNNGTPCSSKVEEDKIEVTVQNKTEESLENSAVPSAEETMGVHFVSTVEEARKTPSKSASKVKRAITPRKAAVEDTVPGAVSPVTTETAEVFEQPRKITPAINTPTRKAIQALRKSTAGERQSLKDRACDVKSDETVGKQEESNRIDPVSVAVVQSESLLRPSSLKTPIKNAINAKRKSYSAGSTAAVAVPVNDTAVETTSVAQSSASITSVEEGSAVAAVVAVVAPSVPTMKTPLKRAIQERRKEYKDHEQVQASESVALRASAAVNAHLLRAIQARRKSAGGPPVASPVHPTALSASSSNVPVGAAMSANLLKAIQARRKSGVSLAVISGVVIPAAAPHVSDAPSSMAMNAHLLKAIQARRKSGAAPMTIAASPAKSSSSSSISSALTLHSALKAAIQGKPQLRAATAANNKSESIRTTTTASAGVSLSEALKAAILARRRKSITAPSAPINKTPSKTPSKTPTGKAPSASMTTAAAALLPGPSEVSCPELKKKLATPLRRAIQQLHTSPEASGTSIASGSVAKSVKKTQQPADAPVTPSEAASTINRSTSKKRRLSAASTPIAVEATQELSVESNSSEEAAAVSEFISDVLSASKVQMTASVLAAELISSLEQTENLTHDATEVDSKEEELQLVEAVSIARVLFEMNNNSISCSTTTEKDEEDLGEVVTSVESGTLVSVSAPCTPATATVVHRRGRQSLLGSLQKKASGSSSATAAVDALSESEMSLIDCYANQLEALDLDPEEAYAMALDAYLQGIELSQSELLSGCNNKEGSEKTEINDAEDCVVMKDSTITSQESASAPPAESTASIVEHTEPEADFSSALRSLFALPVSFTDALDDSRDEQLVDQYAVLMQACCPSLSPSVAYGVALDAFLADPVAFRHRVGHLPLPSDQQPVAIRAAIPLENTASSATPVASAVKKSTKKQRKSLAVETSEPVSVAVVQSESLLRPSSLKTPIKNAINAKRKSYSAGSTAAVAVPVNDTAVETTSVAQSSASITSVEAADVDEESAVVAVVAPSVPTMKTPQEKRRKSVAPSPAAAAASIDASISVAATPATDSKRQLKRQSTSKKLNGKTPVKGEEETPVEIEDSAAHPAVEAGLEVVEVYQPVVAASTEPAVVCEPLIETSASEELPALQLEEKEEDVMEVKKIKATTGRKGKKRSATEEKREEVSEVSVVPIVEAATLAEIESEKVQLVEPVKKGRAAAATGGGSRKKAKTSNVSVNTEEAAEEVKQPEAVVSAEQEAEKQGTDETLAAAATNSVGRKRKQTKEISSEEVELKNIPSDVVQVPAAAEAPAVVLVKGSRKTKVTPTAAAAAAPVEVKEEEVMEVPTETTAPTVKRSRKGTTAVEPRPTESQQAAPAPVKKGKKAPAVVVELQEDEEEALAILCDGCDKEYFVDEVGLKAVPKGDWFCAKCVEKSNKKQQPSAKGGKAKTEKAQAAVKGRARRG